MAILRTNFPDVFDDRQAELFFRRFKMRPLVHREVLKVKNTTAGHDDAFKMAGFGTFILKAEGTPISFDDPVQSQRRRVAISTFGLAYRISMESEEDAQYDVWDQLPEDLGDAGRDHQETLGFSLYNDAFTGTSYTGLDGVSLCNTAHPSLKPGVATQSNQLSPGVALSTTALESMVTSMRTAQDDTGRRINLKPSILLCHPNDEHNAARLLESEFEPNTAENQINVMRSSRTGIKPITSPHLTDTDAFWLLVEVEMLGNLWLQRKQITFTPSYDNVTFERIYSGHYRANVRGTEWRGMVGSNPS